MMGVHNCGYAHLCVCGMIFIDRRALNAHLAKFRNNSQKVVNWFDALRSAGRWPQDLDPHPTLDNDPYHLVGIENFDLCGFPKSGGGRIEADFEIIEQNQNILKMIRKNYLSLQGCKYTLED